MDSVPAILQYFIFTVGATMTGVVYWLTIENLQPLQPQPRKFEKLWLAAVLCVLISPLGAWVVSSVLKIRSTVPTLKDTNK